ncbi:hypothetical protein JKF63_06733 [Porcisia hertigi]|uniref:Uncharacterized protein n=1 Tax=Porcisia hertigi TaxID=2761500 RepID=A0A836LIW7_9TRYP|nr:hypothetical protein JKF63_06733 [Porcisia hertigi]
MLLTKEEVQTITLNAKSVHKYADQAFFPAEISQAGARIGDQSFLNFFVRYHHRHAPERYSWSRVRRVMLLEDLMTRHKTGAEPLVTSSTIEWRGKTFWVCFAVESVVPGSSSSDASNDSKDEEIVMLPQLSNTIPTDDEILAFCVASASQRPTEVYTDGVLDEAPVAPPVLLGAEAVDPTAEQDSATPPATASRNLRVYVPTPRQIGLLRQYKKQHLTYHQWTEAEIEESKAQRQRYSTIGVAAAPVRTAAYMQQQRVEESKHQKRAFGTSSSSPATKGLNVVDDGHVDLTQESIVNATAESACGYAMTQTQSSTRSAIAPTSSTVAATPVVSPLSPFLPRSVLRAQPPPPQQQQQPPHTVSAASTSNLHSPSKDSFSVPLLGDDASPPFSQLSASQAQSPGTQMPSGSLSSLSQHLSHLREAEESFFHYISDESRSAYLNRLAEITKRNRDTNTRNRRRGIANERRLERKGNLLESCGLWITDDKERASKAEDYVKAQAGESSSTKKNDEGATAAGALAGGDAAGDGADTARRNEDAFVERFKAYYDAQRISFMECAEADLIVDGSDADINSILQAANATSSGTDSACDKTHALSSVGSSTNEMRLGRRPWRRLLPNRLRTEESSPALVQAQLVHRSTVRMAKRERGE